ncbi:MAG: hypothetical protein ACRCYQ_13015 [Nocardioides sp.]
MDERHVFEDQHDGDGSYRYSAAYLTQDGTLVIEIHDLGPVVRKFFGAGEYEARETFSPEQTERLRASLGADLLAEIARRFPRSARGLTEHAEANGIGRGAVWNRIGD